MLKTTNHEITFSEIPDEITLCINISGCPNHCYGCHSPFLWEDIGEPLTIKDLYYLIDKNSGISCICFMGGDSEPETINTFAEEIKFCYDIKTAWYSGRNKIAPEINIKNFDYIKVGPYIEKKGPLTSPTTNQRLYKVVDNELVDVTNKFWK